MKEQGEGTGGEERGRGRDYFGTPACYNNFKTRTLFLLFY